MAKKARAITPCARSAAVGPRTAGTADLRLPTTSRPDPLGDAVLGEAAE